MGDMLYEYGPLFCFWEKYIYEYKSLKNMNVLGIAIQLGQHYLICAKMAKNLKLKFEWINSKDNQWLL